MALNICNAKAFVSAKRYTNLLYAVKPTLEKQYQRNEWHDAITSARKATTYIGMAFDTRLPQKKIAYLEQAKIELGMSSINIDFVYENTQVKVPLITDITQEYEKTRAEVSAWQNSITKQIENNVG